jgi:hypothetical protein
MRRGWAATIVLAGLALGLFAFERSGSIRSIRSADHRPHLDLAAEVPGHCPGDPALCPGSETVPTAGREPLLAANAGELAQAHWVQGRVVFPAGTPADESSSVEATGRPFSDGSIHRCRVGPDGRFRVAFSPGAKAGWIGLEGRYLYLRARSRWRLADLAQEVTLEPELGSIVVGRVIVPAGARARSPEGETEPLATAPDSTCEIDRRVPLRDGGFVFERVPSRTALALD